MEDPEKVKKLQESMEERLKDGDKQLKELEEKEAADKKEGVEDGDEKPAAK